MGPKAGVAPAACALRQTSTTRTPGNESAGSAFPQFERTLGDRRGRFDDVAGSGFVVLVTGDASDALTPGRRRFLDSIGARMVLIVPPEDDHPGEPHPAGGVRVADVTGGYRAHLKEIDVETAVVRPDFALSGAVARTADLGELLDELADTLHWIAPATTEER